MSEEKPALKPENEAALRAKFRELIENPQARTTDVSGFEDSLLRLVDKIAGHMNKTPDQVAEDLIAGYDAKKPAP